MDMGRDNLSLLHRMIGGPPRGDTTQASAGWADLRLLLGLGTSCGESRGGGRGGTGGAVILQSFDGRRSKYIWASVLSSSSYWCLFLDSKEWFVFVGTGGLEGFCIDTSPFTNSLLTILWGLWWSKKLWQFKHGGKVSGSGCWDGVFCGLLTSLLVVFKMPSFFRNVFVWLSLFRCTVSMQFLSSNCRGTQTSFIPGLWRWQMQWQCFSPEREGGAVEPSWLSRVALTELSTSLPSGAVQKEGGQVLYQAYEQANSAFRPYSIHYIFIVIKHVFVNLYDVLY